MLLRTGLALLLTCACAQAMAQNGRNAAPDPSTCPETEVMAREDAAPTSGSHTKATATRDKYAKPTTATNRSIGGGGDDEALPRPRAPKWHSFLPGMFR